MHESPSSAQLVAAVRTFLTDVAMPSLSGHTQFSARVAANALALVERELASRSDMDARACELYSALLNSDDDDLTALEAKLCIAIVGGEIGITTPNLLSSLQEIALAQLSIDQPTYSGGAI
jgi:L-serine deaminase